MATGERDHPARRESEHQFADPEPDALDSDGSVRIGGAGVLAELAEPLFLTAERFGRGHSEHVQRARRHGKFRV